MKILMIMDPGILVPPKGYGGHERLIEMFARQYVKLGHQVHLLVTQGSHVDGCVVYSLGKEGFPPKKITALKSLPKAWLFLLKHKNKYDLIHNFGRLAYLLPVLHHPVKKIMTYGREIDSHNIERIEKIGTKNFVFTACSKNLHSRIHNVGRWEVVYNAIEFAKYTLTQEVSADAPLIFLGRVERVKGCHTAIEVAKATGNKLIIAGNISPLPEEQEYFKTCIEPYIDDTNIIYVGQVNDEQKNALLGNAKALLFPIEWDEPFGIVMIESMACGTPVLAFKRGSVDEVVEENVTGFKVATKEEMIGAVERLKEIDRSVCRQTAERRFDASTIARQYLGLFNEAQKNILVVTTGQPAANPRVAKEYSALKKSGYNVKVLYTYSASWSYKIDEKRFAEKQMLRDDFVLVGGNPYTQQLAYACSRSFHKLFFVLSKLFPSFKKLAIARSSFPLLMAAKKYKADIYIAHYLGALPAAIAASQKHGGKVIFDAEDFHRGEAPYYSNQVRDVIELEDSLLPHVDVITAASPLICKKYQQLYPHTRVTTINNVFSKIYLQDQPRQYDKEANELKLFWFSQHIGPNRGLEVIIDALNLLSTENVSLHLLGNIRTDSYGDTLSMRCSRPHLVHFYPSLEPDEIFAAAAKYDIGLAAEIPYCENRDICLTNKIFTYLVSGLCVLASNTAAQQNFMEEYPSVGALYKYDDAADLVAKIKEFYNNRELVQQCKKNALQLAETTFNWEAEGDKLVNLIASV